MKILQEIINPNTVNLTNSQQGVLVIIKMSPTPEVAYESTNGSDQSVYARNSLRSLGLVRVGNNQAELTNDGHQVLINYNLTDDTGQLTDRGNEVLKAFSAQDQSDQARDNDEDEL
jgi:predicted methyltransferase